MDYIDENAQDEGSNDKGDKIEDPLKTKKIEEIKTETGM